MGSKRVLGTFAALALMTLSGCAEEKRAVLPSVTSKPSTSSVSPTPTAVGGRAGVPDAAKKHTRAGAEAFARYYLKMVNLAMRTPDAALIAQLGDAGCVFCRNMEKEATDLESREMRFDGDVVRINSLGPLGGEWKDNAEPFTADLLQLRAQVVDESGKSSDSQNEKPLDRRMVITWANGKWYMYELAP